MAPSIRKLLRTIALAVVLMACLWAGLNVMPAHAYPVPPPPPSGVPYWLNGYTSTTGVRYLPVQWPVEPVNPLNCTDSCGQWVPYTAFGAILRDPRTQDPSNGGTAPQNYVNIASGYPDKTLPSLYTYFDNTSQMLMFRWRVEQRANTYATGPTAGAFSSSDPWNSALWTVFYDLNGDGFRDMAAHLDGSSGSPNASIDRMAAIWGENSNSQSLDYAADPTIHLLEYNYSGFVYSPTKQILNFGSSLAPSSTYPSVQPTSDWPNGAGERIWNYGTSRSILISNTATFAEFFVDYQIPLHMLDASALGGPKMGGNVPFSLLFCTGNSLQNPMQKDCASNQGWLGSPSVPAQFGDNLRIITPTGVLTTIQPPIVAAVSASGCASTTLTAQVRDTLSVTNGIYTTSVQTATFYAYDDTNANGIADDPGSTWTLVATGKASSLNTWTATWNSSSFFKGQWLIGVRAADNPAYNSGSKSNVTFSYYQTQAEIDSDPSGPAPSGQTWWANGDALGTTAITSMINSCGAPPPTIAKSVTPSLVPASGEVTFTVSIANNSGQPLSLSTITDTLPPGFTYLRNVAGALTPSSSPAVDAGGAIAWTFAATSVPGSSTRTFSFVATAPAIEGYYYNLVAAVTGGGTLSSPPAEVIVGTPRLTIEKDVEPSSVIPGDVVTYTIAYANNGANDVASAVISDTVPANLNYQGSMPPGTYTAGTRRLTWSVGNLAAHTGPFTVQYTATVASPYPVSGDDVITNTASISSNLTSPIYAAVSTNVHVPAPDLTLRKVASAGSITPGGTISFTIAFRNIGDAPASNVRITDAIPAGFGYISAAPTPLSAPAVGATGTVVWYSSTLAAGVSSQATLVLTPTKPYTGSALTRNAAAIGSDEHPPITSTVYFGVVDPASSCTTYYFGRQTATITSTAQMVATTTVPTAVTAASVLAQNTGGIVEKLRFYSDPATVNSQILSGTISTTLYIDRVSGAGNNVYVSLYDYDNANGAVVPIGAASAYTTPAGLGYTGPLTFTANTSRYVLAANHRLLWIVTANIANQAFTVYYDSVTQPSNSNICATVASPPLLTLAKQASSDTVAPGETLKYTLTFANVGETTATGAVLTETLPSGLTFVSAALNGAPVTPVANSSPYTFSVSTLGAPSGVITASQSGKLVITARVNTPLDDSIATLDNIAALASTQTPTQVTGSASAVVVRPNVSIHKVADPPLLEPGDRVTFTLTIPNDGIGTAYDVRITDTLPIASYFTYVAGSDHCAPGWAVFSNGAVVGSIASLAPGEVWSCSFRMQVGPSTPTGIVTLDNSAVVSDAGTDGSRTSNIATVTINSSPRLEVAKSVSPAGTVNAGELLTYTLRVSSTGNVTATSVVLADPIPANTTYVSSVGGSFDAVNNAVDFVLGDMAPGSTALRTFTVRADVPLPSGFSPAENMVTAYGSNTQAVTDSVSSQVEALPQLTVGKSGPAVLAYPAASLSAAADDTTILAVDNASQLAAGQYITVAGQLRRITWVDIGTITVDSAVTANSGAPLFGSATYYIDYANTGTAAATNVILTDTLPANAIFVTATQDALFDGTRTVTVSLGTLATGASGQVQVTVFPTGTGAPLVNTAALAGDQNAPVNSVVTTTVGGLVIDKLTTTPNVTQTLTGTSAIYVLRLQNTLPVSVTNVVVVDTLAPGFTYASTVDITGGTRTAVVNPTFGDSVPAWGAFTVEGGSTLAITFTAAITTSVGPGTYQNNVAATATGGGVAPFDPFLTPQEDVTVAPLVADLAIGKTSAPSPHVAGQAITYTVVVSNAGPGAVNFITVTDNLPDGVNDVSFGASAGTYNPGNGAWSGFMLAMGEQITLTITGTVALTHVGALTNTAAVTTNVAIDPNPTNNTAQDVNQQADLQLSKNGVLNMTIVAPVDQADAGDVISYTLVATNTGTAELNNVSIIDPKLGVLDCVQPLLLEEDPPFVVGATLSCTGIYTLTWADIAVGTITNTASATSDETPPVTASYTTTIPASPRFTLAKLGSSEPAVLNGTVQYTIVVTNTGNVTLTNVTVRDTKLGLTQTIPSLAAGAVTTVTGSYGPVAVGDLPGPIVNTASVTATTPGGTPLGPMTDVYTTPVASLAVLKVGTEGPMHIGDTVEYTIVVTNTGSAALQNVTVRDAKLGLTQTIPSLAAGAVTTVTGSYGPVGAGDLPGPIVNTASVTATTPGGVPLGPVTDSYTTPVASLAVLKVGVPDSAAVGDMLDYTIVVTNTGSVLLQNVTVRDAKLGLTQTIPSLAAGAVTTVTGSYGPVGAGDLPGPIVNTASVTATTPGGVPLGPVTDTFTTSIASLEIAKLGAPAEVQVGDTVHYTIVVTNTGSVLLQNVTVRDAKLGLLETIPSLGAAQATTVTGSYGPVGTGDLPGPIVNTASVTATLNGATQLGPVTDVYTTPVVSLAVLKLGTTGPVEVGDTVDYTIVVTNTGSAALQNVTVRDAKLGLTQTIPSLAGGSVTTVTGSYGPVAAADLPGPIFNTASVTATTPEGGAVGPITGTHTVTVLPIILTGIVTDTMTGLPIPGAQVVVTDSAGLTYTLTTDAGGAYTVTNPALGVAMVTAGKPGYTTAGAQPTIVPGINRQDLGLTPTLLTGVVRDALTGLPLPVATVIVTDSTGVTITLTTDVSGAYTVTNPALGVATVTASKPGYAAATAQPAIVPGINRQDLALTPTLLTGIVTDTLTGLPIPGAQVVVTDSGGITYTLTTDASGAYTATNLALGPAAVTAAKQGYTTAGAQPTIVPGLNRQDLGLTPNLLTGVVRDVLTGLPLPGATVVVTDSAGITHTVTADANGAYTVTALALGPAVVTASKPGYATMSSSVEVQPGINQKDVPLPPAVLTGRVTDATTGLPISGTTIIVVDSAGITYTVQTDSDGRYAVETLAVGSASVAAHKMDYHAASATPVIQSGANVQDFALLRASTGLPDDGEPGNYAAHLYLPVVTGDGGTAAEAAAPDNAPTAQAPLPEAEPAAPVPSPAPNAELPASLRQIYLPLVTR